MSDPTLELEKEIFKFACSFVKQAHVLAIDGVTSPEAQAAVKKAMVSAEALAANREYLPGEDDYGWLAINVSVDGAYRITESQLREIRNISRNLQITGDVLDNAITNRVNFVVGDGLTYSMLLSTFGTDPAAIIAAAKASSEDEIIGKALANWKLFCDNNKFDMRLQDWENRANRDGEALLRLFDTKECPTIRFVYPEYLQGENNESEYGISYEGQDIETPSKYHIRYPKADSTVPVSAKYIIHDKRNVDMETPRGLATAYPVFANVRRISKLSVNVSVLAAIQSAIALVRKHENATGAQVARFANRGAIGTTSAVTGQSVRKKFIEAGTIVDAPKGTSYDFPAHSVATKNFLDVIDKELARVAARFVQPVSWLLSTEDPEPLNPGSPTVANLKRAQKHLYTHVEDVFWRVQELMGLGDIKTIKAKYTLFIKGPRIPVAKAVDQARIDEINLASGATSPQEIAAANGLEYSVNRVATMRHRMTAMDGEAMPGDQGKTNVGASDGAKTKADAGGGNQKV